MGYTNKTTHYELPQYVATDKPKYLTDFNETMVAIDTQMYANAQAAATADGKAVAAKDVADGAVSSIGTLNAQINGDPTDPSDTGLSGQVSDINGDVNTIESLIGDGNPTTSGQTIIGAINGLEGAIAPREDGDNLANSYAEGEQFARGGSVYKALTALTAGTAFASLTLNTDYTAADTLVEQIATVSGNIPTVSGYTISEKLELAVVTADGVKTRAELLADLYAELAARYTANPGKKYLITNMAAGAIHYWCDVNVSDEILTTYTFETSGCGADNATIQRNTVAASSSDCHSYRSLMQTTGNTFNDYDSNVPAAQIKYSIRGYEFIPVV